MEEEKLAMCSTEVGKRPKYTRSEDQVAQGVERIAKNVIRTKENDESTIGGNDTQFETPPA